MGCRVRTPGEVTVVGGELPRPASSEARARRPAGRAKGIGRTPKRLTVSEALLRFAGKATSLPPDAARCLEHYLYGQPKR